MPRAWATRRAVERPVIDGHVANVVRRAARGRRGGGGVLPRARVAPPRRALLAGQQQALQVPAGRLRRARRRRVVQRLALQGARGGCQRARQQAGSPPPGSGTRAQGISRHVSTAGCCTRQRACCRPARLDAGTGRASAARPNTAAAAGARAAAPARVTGGACGRPAASLATRWGTARASAALRDDARLAPGAQQRPPRPAGAAGCSLMTRGALTGAPRTWHAE
jgi:hypothetical protein